MMAKCIHDMSERKNGPFQVINCSAIPESLLESELFGYVKGAFTGAINHGKIGLFESARQGTVFLDEIGDISLSLQVKLLQVLQDRKFRKIGDVVEISADFRLITATNQDLEEKLRSINSAKIYITGLMAFPLVYPHCGTERKTLGFCLMPTLSNSTKSTEAIRSFGEVLDAFYQYNWPGNIRELKSVVERTC